MIDYSPNRLVSTCCMSFFYQACHRQPYHPHLSAFESLYKTDPTYFRGLRNISTNQKASRLPHQSQIPNNSCAGCIWRCTGTRNRIQCCFSLAFDHRGSQLFFVQRRHIWIGQLHSLNRDRDLDLSHLMMCLISPSKTVIYPMNSTLIKIDKPAQQCAVQTITDLHVLFGG